MWDVINDYIANIEYKLSNNVFKLLAWALYIHVCPTHTPDQCPGWVCVAYVMCFCICLEADNRERAWREGGREESPFLFAWLFFFLLPRVEKMLQMCNFGQNTAVVTVTFYPAIQSQWWRGETNSTRTNPHILHVQVLNINNNGEERNTADLWLSMFITDDTPRLPQYQNEKQRLEEHFVCRRSIR